MKNIVLIGCGNIGTRLLQSLITVPLFGPSNPVQVHCVDPEMEGQERVGARVREVLGDTIPDFLKISVSGSLPNFDAEIDLAIVATTSKPRFSIVQGLLDICSPRNLILEKFLFVEHAAYERVQAQLEAGGIQCWVHAPRPTWPGYKSLKDRISNAGPIVYRVGGANWALASNAVHFVAAFTSLTGESISSFDGTRLDSKPVENKRDGYLEVTGQLSAIGSAGSKLEMVCAAEGRSVPAVDIITRAGRYVILESEQRMFANDESTEWKWRDEEFKILFASQMQEPLSQVLQGDPCDLPLYSEMVAPHQNLMKIFNTVFFGEDSELSDCPVT